MTENNAPIASFNRDAFLANFHEMLELAYEAVEKFLSVLPDLVSRIENAIDARDAGELELSAHTLKGVLSNFYAQRSELWAWRLEQMSRGKFGEDTKTAFLNLKIELRVLAEDLQSLVDSRKAA